MGAKLKFKMLHFIIALAYQEIIHHIYDVPIMKAVGWTDFSDSIGNISVGAVLHTS